MRDAAHASRSIGVSGVREKADIEEAWGHLRPDDALTATWRLRLPLRTDAYYRGLAEKALKDAGIDEPPVPIEDLAGRYGIPVRYAVLPAFFEAAIIAEDGLPVILLNSIKDEYVRRKALAHEVGHILVVLNDPEGAYARHHGDHPDASTVADELLTPAFMIVDQAQKWFNDYRYLARLFGVTEQEMMRKMVDMGIIHQRGVLWDY